MTGEFDSWAGARNSMRRFERAAVRISMNWLVGAGLLAASVVLFIILGALLNVNLERLRENFRWTQHADTILFHLDSIQQSLFQGEASTRAFALTADTSNLAVLAAAQARWRKDERELRALVADNAVQQQRLDKLYPVVETRFARMLWFVHLEPAARAAAITTAAKYGEAIRAQQNRISADISARLTEFREKELLLLQDRRAFAERDSTTLNYIEIVITLLAPLCGLAGFILLFREYHHRHNHEVRMELIHTQRLALMGETASMLAHEVNQPLAAATNYLAAANRMAGHPDMADKLKDAVQKTTEQIGRAVTIVQRLRNFIGKRDSERAAESPALLVADAVALYGTLGSGVRLQTQVAPGLPNLFIDRVQIQQVLVNLMRNALEAMQDSTRRELELEVAAGGRDMVQFRLRDTGPGLPQEVADKLFRPFVSTKAGGMGVGLSICQKIVTDHGGQIWAEAGPGGGTVFCFALPELHNEAAAQAA
jgi:C4-dicarboxylate-specific signal transduction histidine kinase